MKAIKVPSKQISLFNFECGHNVADGCDMTAIQRQA